MYGLFKKKHTPDNSSHGQPPPREFCRGADIRFPVSFTTRTIVPFAFINGLHNVWCAVMCIFTNAGESDLVLNI